LLAAYLDAPFEPSPYRPVSRLFWNEFYLALERLPEWEGCPVARELASRPELSMVRTELRRMDLVDYRGAIALKRAILEPMVRCFFDGGDDARKDSFALWLVANPEASQYAAFRARVDELRVDWLAWSRSEGEAVPRPDSPEERYHLYCQWQMAEQLGALARDAAAGAAAGLFLDLPVGVHSGGFDTWRRPQLFVHDMSAGAPPDAFFELGQYWDSPPLHPERARQDGHRYFATCLRQHMRFASFLRIDHVMSLHRLFWVPFGSGPSAGVYVRYPAEELYAVLSLESHRNQTVVVGEDLGTVPPEVRPAMRRHGVLRTWVAQTSFRPRSSDPVATPPPGCVAGINTHDMFPFAGFVEGADIGARLQTGQVDEAGARREAAARARLVTRLETWAARNTAGPGPGGSTRRAAAVSEGSADPGRPAVAGPPLGPGAHVLLGPLISRLLASDAALTLVALEDLHGETRPQNMPGMGDERGNWRRKAAGIGQQ
jgi:4-alpha-glucanotransferase